jgi:small-conductance mechanosensitive channel
MDNIPFHDRHVFLPMLTTFDTILRQLVDVLSTLPDLAYKWIATIALFGVVILVKRAIDRRLMGKTETLTPVQRQWIHSNRTMSRLALLIVVLTIWLPSLSSIAFPLTAVAVALVIATKELIVCVLGTWFRIVNKPFAVGDWIELDRSIRGEILDFGILATKLLEMDIPENPYGYTGNIITLPNSVFLTNRVFNLTRQKKVTFHTFIITLGFIHETPPRAKALQDIIEQMCASPTPKYRFAQQNLGTFSITLPSAARRRMPFTLSKNSVSALSRCITRNRKFRHCEGADFRRTVAICSALTLLASQIATSAFTSFCERVKYSSQ